MLFENWDKLAQILSGVAPVLQQKIDLINARPTL
jgi:hypothetical protein